MAKRSKWLWQALRAAPDVEKIDARELKAGDRLIGDRDAVAAKETTYLQKLGVEKPGKPLSSDHIVDRTIRKAKTVQSVTHDHRDEVSETMGARCELGSGDAVVLVIHVPYDEAVLVVRA